MRIDIVGGDNTDTAYSDEIRKCGLDVFGRDQCRHASVFAESYKVFSITRVMLKQHLATLPEDHADANPPA